ILALSSLDMAGPAGGFIFSIFDKLLGWGYYLLPVTFLILAGVFFMTERQKVLLTTAIGGSVLVLSALGIIDIVSPSKGGLLGSLGGTIQVPFGYTAPLVLTVTFFWAAAVATLNMPIRMRNPSLKIPAEALEKNGKKNGKELTDEEEENIAAAAKAA